MFYYINKFYIFKKNIYYYVIIILDFLKIKFLFDVSL